MIKPGSILLFSLCIKHATALDANYWYWNTFYHATIVWAICLPWTAANKVLYNKHSHSVGIGNQLLYRDHQVCPTLASSPLWSSSFWCTFWVMCSMLSSSLTLRLGSDGKGWTEDMFMPLQGQGNWDQDRCNHLTSIPRLHCDINNNGSLQVKGFFQIL